MPDEALRRELLALAAEDRRVRGELVAEGTLFDGYHPRMEAVHRRNAARLRMIIGDGDWPGISPAGADGEEAAWLIVQHAIGEPEFMRSMLALLERAVAAGEAPPWQAAMLADRIARYEGRPQRYGTQLEPNEEGWLRAADTEDPAGLDARRAAVGLEPIAERLAREPRSPLPRDRDAFEREYTAWLRRTGWRD